MKQAGEPDGVADNCVCKDPPVVGDNQDAAARRRDNAILGTGRHRGRGQLDWAVDACRAHRMREGAGAELGGDRKGNTPLRIDVERSGRHVLRAVAVKPQPGLVRALVRPPQDAGGIRVNRGVNRSADCGLAEVGIEVPRIAEEKVQPAAMLERPADVGTRDTPGGAAKLHSRQSARGRPVIGSCELTDSRRRGLSGRRSRGVHSSAGDSDAGKATRVFDEVHPTASIPKGRLARTTVGAVRTRRTRVEEGAGAQSTANRQAEPFARLLKRCHGHRFSPPYGVGLDSRLASITFHHVRPLL